MMILGALLVLLVVRNTEAQSRSLGMPTLKDSDVVHFYYLRSDVAYNIDIDNVTESMHGGYETHAGIGVWDITTDMKFSIELVPTTGIGNIFFPVVDTADTSEVEMTWMNVGEIHTTSPIDEAWNSGQFITATIGAGYLKWATAIQERVKASANVYQLMQPFTVVQLTSETEFESVLRDNRKTSMGNTLVSNQDSFSFATEALDILGTLGCDLTTFQTPRITTLGYSTPVAAVEAIPVVDVSIKGSSRETRLQVAQWFETTKECALGKISPANGIVHFVRLLSDDCLTQGYAYLYRDDSSVYNVTLAQSPYRLFTTEVRVELQRRVILDLLSGFTPDDIAVYTLTVLALVGIVVAFGFGKLTQRRRRVSFEGEVLAREAVIQNILMESDRSRDQIIDYFYHEKKRDAWTFQRWFRELWEGELEGEHIVRQDHHRGTDTSSFSTASYTSSGRHGDHVPPSSLYKDPRYTEGGKVKALDRDQIKKVAARREKEERRLSRNSGSTAARSQGRSSARPSEIGMTMVSSVSNPVLSTGESLSVSSRSMLERHTERTEPAKQPEPQPEPEPESLAKPDPVADQGKEKEGEKKEESRNEAVAPSEERGKKEAKEGEKATGEGEGGNEDESDEDYIPLGELRNAEERHRSEAAAEAPAQTNAEAAEEEGGASS